MLNNQEIQINLKTIHDKLAVILRNKVQEVEQLKANNPVFDLSRNSLDFGRALQRDGLCVIAEIKRRSPSKGAINESVNVADQAKLYESGGASCISVLTDKVGFGGSLKDLAEVRAQCPNTPILRKDFIVDPIQILEAKHHGADCVLLIVSVLQDRTAEFVNRCDALGLHALVEVKTEQECEIAVKAGAKIIGINNRDLVTFEVDVENALRLIDYLPGHVVKVAESGIHEVELAKRYFEAGFDGVLVGEALMRAQSPAEFVRELKFLEEAPCYQ